MAAGNSPASPFFFYCSGHHRDLHSFPTRRSSDLSCGSLPRTRVRCPRHQPGNRSRSEEHTSELQSRFDLVCRLLLEKKKKLTDLNCSEEREDAFRLSYSSLVRKV